MKEKYTAAIFVEVASLLHVIRQILSFLHFCIFFYSLVWFFFCWMNERRRQQNQRKKTNLFIFIFFVRSNRVSFFFLYCMSKNNWIKGTRNVWTKLKRAGYSMCSSRMTDWFCLFDPTIFNTCCSFKCVHHVASLRYVVRYICFVCTMNVREYWIASLSIPGYTSSKQANANKL